MTANALVVGPVDVSSPLGGTMLLESLGDLAQALESGSWLEVGLAAFSTVMDTVAAVMDPLGQLIAAGLGWLMEHVEPLKGWLNDLTGDAGAVLGFAGTWENIAAAMAAAADELDRVVRADLAGMSGAAVVAYGRYQGDFAAHLRAVAGSSGAVASSLRVCSTVVQVVHDLVRDALAELVGAAISWAAEIVLTVGLGTPWVIGQVTSRVSSLATRVGTKVTEVVTSARSLKNLVEALKEALASLARTLRGAKPGAVHSPDVPHAPGTPGTPHTPGTPPTTHPSGLTVGDGSRRTLEDQLADPHIHPNNASIVEPGYDPFHGMTPDEFRHAYYEDSPAVPGMEDWRWPPHDGAVPGSEHVETLTSANAPDLDRIGGDGGAYFSPTDTPFSERALPPDRLNFDRGSYHVDTTHPSVVAGNIKIETSTIADAFGQPGGGIQYRFFDAAGNKLSAGDLKALGIIVPN